MKSIRRNVFETNSSSTHSLSITNIAYYEKVEDVIPKGEPLYLGETDSSDFLLCTETTRYSGFKDKLHCLMAFLICYYEDKVEFIVYSRIDEVEKLTERIIDITSATATITLGEEFYLSEQNGNIIL